ncbi:MAG: TIGR03016 family PEP-CTERM system-associated outer membrane protein [Rhodanobacter sp.]
MRPLAAPVIVSTMILGGWLIGARAQNVGLQMPSALNSAAGDQVGGFGNGSPGIIPQPTIDDPGVVTGVTLGELYTDNLKLASSGKPKQSSWITQIQPFFRSAFSNTRLSGVFDYMLTGYIYPGNSSYNQLAQNLNAHGTLSILPQHLFLDGTASYGREIINNELPSGSGTFFLNNNQANVAMGTLGPYWIQDLGRVGTTSVRYTLGRVLYGQQGISGQNANRLNGIPDITSKAFQFILVSPKDQTWGWNLGYSDQRIEPDFGRGIDYAAVNLGASWQIRSDTQLLADVGKENKFLPNGTVEKLGASLWDIGFDWSNTLDNLRLLVGHRFYGPSYQLTWTHSAALLTTAVGYVEQPTDVNQQLLGQGTGQVIVSPGDLSYIPSLRQRQVYLMKRATGSAIYTMPRGSLQVRLYDERRTYITLDNAQEQVANANIDWLFNMGSFTTLTPTVGWQRYQFQDGQVQHNIYEELAFVHQLNPKNFGSVRLRHDSRTTDSTFVMPGSQGYRVNVIFVQWTHLF